MSASEDIRSILNILRGVYDVGLEVAEYNPGGSARYRVVPAGGDYFGSSERSRPFDTKAEVSDYLEGILEGLRMASEQGVRPRADFAGATWYILLPDGTFDTVTGAKVFRVPADIEPVSARDVVGHSTDSLGLAGLLVDHFARRFR